MSDDEPPDLLAFFTASEAGADLEAQLQDAFRAFGQAMMCGQLLEWATGLAAPAVTVPVDDVEVASAAVTRGVKLKFVQAIQEFETAVAAAGDIDLPDDLVARLHEARRARNDLAHGWVWNGGMRAFAGEAGAVTAELDALAASFMGLLGELFEAVFTETISGFGIDPETFAAARDGMTAALIARPDLAEGLRFPDDTDVFMSRVLEALADEEHGSPT